MKTVTRPEGETIETFVRRYYAVRWIYGFEDDIRIQRAADAVLEENPDFETLSEVRIPQIEGIPYLERLIENAEDLHPAIHEILDRIQNDELLLKLSFIDPIRLGCEELGIIATPEVVAQVRETLEGIVSFDQERYEDIRDTGRELKGISSIRWIPSSGA